MVLLTISMNKSNFNITKPSKLPMNTDRVNKFNDQVKPHNLTQSSNPKRIMTNIQLHLTWNLGVPMILI